MQVICGDTDRITPFTHAERIAIELPDSELIRVRGTGHMVMMERPDIVNEHLINLIQQCAAGRAAGQRKWWRLV